MVVAFGDWQSVVWNFGEKEKKHTKNVGTISSMLSSIKKIII